MANIKFKGNNIQTISKLPEVGKEMPNFTLVKNDLSTLTKQDIKGKKVIFNIFPSLDTAVCAASVRKFNELVSKLPGTLVLCVSKDLPFAQARFCGAEGLKQVITVSGFRSNFGKDFGLEIVDGLLAGLYSRAIVCCDANGIVSYTQQVPEITEEPKYAEVLENI